MEMRGKCELAAETFDFAVQEAHMRNRTLSRALNQHYEDKRRKTLAGSAQKWGNNAIISVGMLWSVLPFQVLAFLKTVDSVLPVSRLLPILNNEAYWLATTPVTNGALCMACVVFAVFHFYIMEQQVSECLLVSGHWYTVMCTVFSFLAVSTHLYNHSEFGMVGSLLSYYLAYFAIFVGVASLVLKRSQLFHHDDVESMAGIQAAAYTVAVAGPAFLLVAHRTVEANRLRKIQDFKECWAAALVSHLKRGKKPADLGAVFRQWKAVTDNLEKTAAAVVEDMKQAPVEAQAETKTEQKDPSKVATRSSARTVPVPVQAVPVEDWDTKKKELMLSVLRHKPAQENLEQKPEVASRSSADAGALPRKPALLFSAGDLSGAKLKKKADPAPPGEKPVASNKPHNLMAEIMNAKRDKLKPASKRTQQASPAAKKEPPSMMDEIRLRMQARHARMKVEEDDADGGAWE
jgi:hypothetical protein